MTIDDVKWDKEHPLFKGSTFGHLKIGRRKFILVKGGLAGGGYSIGGNIDGSYQEIDVETAEEMNAILADL